MNIFKKVSHVGLIVSFFFTSVLSPASAQMLALPEPGRMLGLTPSFAPAVIKGVKVFPDKPFNFEFYIDTGDSSLEADALRDESSRMVRYFLAALTVPEDKMWVNLSPYEKDQMVPEAFGQTAMGRDVLAQDYVLKQVTSSLLYPEGKAGQAFWQKVYQRVYERFGSSAVDIPVDTFNKVWITPEKAVVYEHGSSAFVIRTHLKVMIESDYFAESREQGAKSEEHRAGSIEQKENSNNSNNPSMLSAPGSMLAQQVLKEVIIPILEKEINEGRNFANLRQIYNAMVLATWYKRSLKDSLLGQAYVDRQKTPGVEAQDKSANGRIYDRYLQAFRQGVYNLIKEEEDPATGERVPRRYFSGGFARRGAGVEELDIQSSPAAALDAAQTTSDHSRTYRLEIKLDPAQGTVADIRPDQAQSIREVIEQSPQDFLLFTEKVLALPEVKFKEVLGHKELHPDMIKFHFDEVSFYGSPDDYSRAVRYKVGHNFFVARIVDGDKKDTEGFLPVWEMPATEPGKVLQVLDRKDFVALWNLHKDPRATEYNMDTSLQRYMRAFMEKSRIHEHDRDLYVEGILGQGWEALVLKVRDADTGEYLALKIAYRSLKGSYDYWKEKWAVIKERKPELLEGLIEFLSYEDLTLDHHGRTGSSILMPYYDAVSMEDLLIDTRGTERLRQGLDIIAREILLIRQLNAMGITFGDMGRSNILAGVPYNGSNLKLIDPHADSYLDPETSNRKDVYQLVHMLYWLVSTEGRTWSPGIYEFQEQVKTGTWDPKASRMIQFHPVLAPEDPAYVQWYGSVMEAFTGTWDKYLGLLDRIVQAAGLQADAAQVAGARMRPGATEMTEEQVRAEIRAALGTVGSGVFLDYMSLPSYFRPRQSGQREFGMGDLGPAAKRAVRWLKSAGQRYQMGLPHTPRDRENGAFRAESVFALNYNLGSPENWLRDGWITEADLDEILPAFSRIDQIDTDEAKLTYKRRLLARAYQTYLQTRRMEAEFERFKREEVYWLDKFARYKAMEAANSGARWENWPREQKMLDPDAIRAFDETHLQEIEAERFAQFLLQRDWDEQKKFEEDEGIIPIIDVPAFSMYASADIWAEPEAFILDVNRKRTWVVGAPPDQNSPKPQEWNHPAPRADSPAYLEFMKNKIRRAKRLARHGLLRVDHFIGLVEPWVYDFNRGAKAGGHRMTGRYLGQGLIEALLEEFPDLPRFFLVEDIGTLTPEVSRIIQYYRFAGMKVPKFIPFNSGPDAVRNDAHFQNNYGPHNAVLSAADYPPYRRWWQALSDYGRQEARNFLRAHTGFHDWIDEHNVAEVFTRYVAGLPAERAIHAMEDVVVREGRSGLYAWMNDPSRIVQQHNWVLRFLPEDFNDETRDRLLAATEEADRTPERAIFRFDAVTDQAPEARVALGILKAGDAQSRAAAQRLEDLLKDGLVRRVLLMQGLLSTTYQHTDGREYLLLSNDPMAGEYLSTEQKAVSLIRAVEGLVPPSDSAQIVSDETLAERARVVVRSVEADLEQAAELFSVGLREEMITFMGALLDEDESGWSSETRSRMLRLNVTREQRRSLGRSAAAAWTRMWQRNERRGVSRKRVTQGIINGMMLESRRELQELRWTALEAFRPELRDVLREAQEHRRIIDNWVDQLDADQMERLLFGEGLPQFRHALAGHASGIAGLLGLKDKADRKRLADPEGHKRYGDYFTHVGNYWMEQTGRDTEERQQVIDTMLKLKKVRWASYDTSDENLDRFLRALEMSLLLKLKEKAVLPALDPAYPSQIDMQFHSYCSDCGAQAVTRIIYRAWLEGRKTLALTDHQTFEGVITALRIAGIFGIEIIPAVEVYSGTRKGNAVVDRRDILVYFPDQERFLSWYWNGLDDETDTVLQDGWDRRIRPEDWGNMPLGRVVAWARARGGVAVLAHPGKWNAESFFSRDLKKAIEMQGAGIYVDYYTRFEEFILETGLSGLEVSHPFLTYEDTQFLLKLIFMYNKHHPEAPLVWTLGTDSHGPGPTVGRENMSSEVIETVSSMTMDPVSGGTPGENVRAGVVGGLRAAAARIKLQEPYHSAGTEVGRHAFWGGNGGSLRVWKNDGTGDTSPSIKAGWKVIDGKKVLVVTNPTDTGSYEGKEWARVDLAGEFGIVMDDQHVYRFIDPLTGLSRTVYGHRLDHGFLVGIAPHATQFVVIEPARLDHAQAATPALKGGIDLNALTLDLEVDRTDSTRSMMIDPKILEQVLNIPGLEPVITSISPMPSLRPVLGLGE
jgi:4-alpha-glucanotransferase